MTSFTERIFLKNIPEKVNLTTSTERNLDLEFFTQQKTRSASNNETKINPKHRCF